MAHTRQHSQHVSSRRSFLHKGLAVGAAGTLSDPLAGSRAPERYEGLTVILAGGHGVAMTALVGLPTSDLLSLESRRL